MDYMEGPQYVTVEKVQKVCKNVEISGWTKVKSQQSLVNVSDGDRP